MKRRFIMNRIEVDYDSLTHHSFIVNRKFLQSQIKLPRV